MTESQQLLAEYVRNGSEAAFRELVTRYLDLVYSTALRAVGGDTHLAEDVAQLAFTDLAQMAPTLAPAVMLGGWLHRHTCFVASKTMRGERRRQTREKQAIEMNALTSSQPDLTSLAPFLDEAINELGEADRTAIMLRFFEQRDFRSVGKALGSSEDAARVRVNRALEKLCSILKRRGVTTSAAAMAALLTANAVQAAPAGLALTISAGALAGKAVALATAGSVTKGLIMTTLQKSLLGATLAVAVGTGIYQTYRAFQFRQENQTLSEQHVALAQQTQQWAREREDAQRQLASLQAENERLKREAVELVKLRSDVARLRSDSQNLKNIETNDSTAAEAKLWAEKVAMLKQRFDQWPGKKTPELQLLSLQAWMGVAGTNQLDSDAACRQAMSWLRRDAKNQFVSAVKRAMEQFIKDHNGQCPSDLSQLTPYLSPSEASCLDSYEFAKPEWVSIEHQHPVWAVIEKGQFTSDGVAIRDGSNLSDPQYDEYQIFSSSRSWHYPVAK